MLHYFLLLLFLQNKSDTQAEINLLLVLTEINLLLEL